ncbi:MAG TPA: BrnA antitoxin family protein [Stellaceae bacterium]|jgi:uncharacterized protein (DUF4415 family)|nr:BrnA antitoxin family protein [Stellaceae bacterium]
MADKTDLKRLQRLTDKDIVKAAKGDPDAAILPREFWRSALMTPPRGKRQVTLRLDAEVLDFFKQAGKGYQTKINHVLKAFVAAQRTD